MKNQRMKKTWMMPTCWSCGHYLAKKATQMSTQDVQELVQDYADIFTKRPGITQLEQHRIEMIMKDPIKVKSYPMLLPCGKLSRKK